MRDEILNIARGFNIDVAGFAPLQNGKQGADFALVCLFPYFVEDSPSYIAKFARSLDYHTICKDYLKLVCQEILDIYPQLECKVYVDSGAFPERLMAVQAGLGFIGQNSCLINDKYGSFVFIGVVGIVGVTAPLDFCDGMETSRAQSAGSAAPYVQIEKSAAPRDAVLCAAVTPRAATADAVLCDEAMPRTAAADAAQENHCRNAAAPRATCSGCGKCIRTCPTGALSCAGGYPRLEQGLCLSALTQQKSLSESQRELLARSKYAWGCDICQDVCPHNKGVVATHGEFYTNRVYDFDNVGDIDSVQFKNQYKKYAFSWRGQGVLKRNLGILRGGGKNLLQNY